jgi:uncharacterized protein YbdZ (MbtH family)
MMRRVFIAASICFLATVCSAQEKYSNSKWHFSFTVPEGWEVITDEMVLNNYTKMVEVRFADAEVLALCREAGAGDKKSSMLVQAQAVGDAKEGMSMETAYEDKLRSNFQWKMSYSYLTKLRDELMKRGQIDEDTKFESQLRYDPNRHVFFETIALPLRNGRATGISTLRVLGGNKAIVLSFELYGKSTKDLLGLVEEVADSFAYDKNHGFGEAPTTDIVKVLWHWLVPGVGTIIVTFLVYKWVASEYG